MDKFFYSSLKKEKFFAFKRALCGDHYEWMDDPAGRQTYDDVSSSNFFLCGKFVRKDFIFMIPSAIQASKFLFGFGYFSPLLPGVRIIESKGEYQDPIDKSNVAGAFRA